MGLNSTSVGIQKKFAKNHYNLRDIKRQMYHAHKKCIIEIHRKPLYSHKAVFTRKFKNNF